MFRKLMAMETEAVRLDAMNHQPADPAEPMLDGFAGMLALCMPTLPQRFGVCAARFDG